MAVVVVCSTVWASAPVKLLVICTVGGVISGYWLTGMFRIANVPTSKMTNEMTMAVTGRLKNIFPFIRINCNCDTFLLFLPGGHSCRRLGRTYLDSGTV